jgi:hypothetical protein
VVEKTEAKEKEITAEEAKAPARRRAAKGASGKMNKGDVLACDLCGLTVVVDECGDIMAAQEVMCCDQPMKLKASRTKASKK